MSTSGGANVQSLASFDAQNLLKPLVEGLQHLKGRIAREKDDDPVPQFSVCEVNEVVDFLKSTVAGLEVSVNKFTPAGVQAMDEDELTKYQENAREASRVLSGLLFAHSHQSFAGQKEYGSLTLRMNKQSDEVMNTLQKLNGFLKGLKAEFPSLLSSGLEPKQNAAKVIKLLEALVRRQHQNPAQYPCYEEQSQNGYGHGDDVTQYYSNSGQPKVQMENPLQAIANNMNNRRQQAEKKQQQLASQRDPSSHYNNGHGQSQQNEGQWLGAQEWLDAWPDSLEELKNVEQMTQALLSALQEDRHKLQIQKESLSQKMEALASFADMLGRLPPLLKQCMLLHLSDLRVDERTCMTLVKWVSHGEATVAHRTLEACRDAMCEEKVLRKVKSIASQSASDASWDVWSDQTTRERVRVLRRESDGDSSISSMSFQRDFHGALPHPQPRDVMFDFCSWRDPEELASQEEVYQAPAPQQPLAQSGGGYQAVEDGWGDDCSADDWSAPVAGAASDGNW